MDGPADIFLSYPGGSPEDSEHVRWLDQLLSRYKLRTWIGERDRPAQVETGDPVIEALEAAPVFMLCLGMRQAGGWGRQEIERAATRAKRDTGFAICTVLLPGAEPGEMSSLPAVFLERPVFDLQSGVTSVATLMPFLWQRLDPPRADLLSDIVAACKGGAQAIVLSGPVGAGKTALAQVVAAELSAGPLDGHAYLQFESRRGIQGMARLALKILRLPVDEDAKITYLGQYQRQLSLGRYLIVFDEMDGVDATELVPPLPSTALIVGHRKPRLAIDHPSFTLPLRPMGRGGTPGGEAAGTQPGYVSDAPGGADLLDVQGPVGALCSVIAAKEVRPPLSIGLFGDWGAGKTFFIEKMRERIDEIAVASREADESAYCSSVRQVVFNAWHYADTDLWASLASRVFEGLADSGGERQRIVETLASSRLELEEARADCEAAQRRIERAREDGEVARRAAENTESRLSYLKGAAATLLQDGVEMERLLERLGTELHREGDAGVTIAVARDLLTFTGSMRELWRRSKLLLLAFAVFTAFAIGFMISGLDPYAAIAPVLFAVAAGARLIEGPVRWVRRASALANAQADALRHRQGVELQDRLEAAADEGA